jgi:hypothetical protein
MQKLCEPPQPSQASYSLLQALTTSKSEGSKARSYASNSSNCASTYHGADAIVQIPVQKPCEFQRQQYEPASVVKQSGTVSIAIHADAIRRIPLSKLPEPERQRYGPASLVKQPKTVGDNSTVTSTSAPAQCIPKQSHVTSNELCQYIFRWVFAESITFRQNMLESVLRPLITEQFPAIFSINVLVVMCVLLKRVSITKWRQCLLANNPEYSRYAFGLPYLVLIAAVLSDKYLEQWDCHSHSLYRDVQKRSLITSSVFMQLELAFLEALDYRTHVTLEEFQNTVFGLVNNKET